MSFKANLRSSFLIAGLVVMMGSVVRANTGGGESAAPAHATEEAHAEPEIGKEVFHGKTVKIHQMANDFLIPPRLWDQLLGHSQVKEVEASKVGHEDEVQTSTILFSPLTVRLIEKNPGVLKDSAVEFQFPKGGGQIDLAQIVTGKPGTFFVKFEPGDMMKSGTFEAFHLSKGKKRNFEGRIYGGGCRSFSKITSVLKKYQKGQGLPFNTTEALHVSALAGHFLFSTSDNDSTTVTQVKFIDSSRPLLFCQNEEPSQATATPEEKE